MSKDFKLHAFHILESYDKILDAVKQDPNLESEIIYMAVQRYLQTSSESCYKLPEEFKNKNKHIEWQKIKPFRNILVHNYLGNIDKVIVTDVINNDMPEIVKILEDEIPDWREIKKKTVEENKKLKLKKD